MNQANLVVLEYISEHGGNFRDYLLRPLDTDEIERLGDEEEFAELDRLCSTLNQDRLVAFGQSLAGSADKRVQCATMVETLRVFFDFVDQVANMTYFLNERLLFVHDHFDAIMNKFIFKFGDVDRQMLEEVCESLLEFYSFLERSKLVPTGQLEEFQELVRTRRKSLLDKMERYNAVRHNENVDEEEREAIREELFGDDHLWPHV